MAIRIFSPILAGATLRDRIVACIGAIIAIALTAGLAGLWLGTGFSTPLIVAPMGASAVLLFAVPASPLAQPWPIIGGNTISALVGVVGRASSCPTRAGDGPRGGAGHRRHVADALPASAGRRGGADGRARRPGRWPHAGLLFPFVPVALNSVLLVALGIVLPQAVAAQLSACRRRLPPPTPRHRRPAGAASASASGPRTSTRRWPRSTRPSTSTAPISTACCGRSSCRRWCARTGTLLCRDIMSRDVVTVGPATTASEARGLAARRTISAPCRWWASDGRLIGTVGLRELAQAEGRGQ